MVAAPPGSPALSSRTTSGSVIISLLGLFLIGQQYLDGLAVGTILAVLAVMGAALSLLPAMLGFSGRAIDRWPTPPPPRTRRRPRPWSGTCAPP
jgi:RND superfamily putative drug exporter